MIVTSTYSVVFIAPVVHVRCVIRCVIDQLLSDGILRKLLTVRDGCLYWNHRTPDVAEYLGMSEIGVKIFNKRFSNQPAGSCSTHDSPYLNLRITLSSKKSYLLYNHSVCFAMYHGRTAKIVDHIDGDTKNNLESNLREVTHSENRRNSKISKGNKSGISSVHQRKDTGKWAAQCYEDGKVCFLGSAFSTAEEALAARKSWEIGKGFTERHGK